MTLIKTTMSKTTTSKTTMSRGLRPLSRAAVGAALALALGCSGGSKAVQQPQPPEPEPDPAGSFGDDAPADEPLATRGEPPVQELAFPDDAELRGAQPGASDSRAFRLPRMNKFRLDNRIEVYLVEQHALPTISMELNFDGGLRIDPDGKRGLASVCMDMLTEGTQELDKIAYSEALADIASTIGSYAGADSQGVWMNTLTKHRDATIALFIDTLRKPGMRGEDFDRMIKRRLESLKQAKAAPASIANRVADTVLYGPDHPYGKITTEESLGALKVEDCAAFHAKWIQPRGAKLFVVGDMTEKDIKAAFSRRSQPALADWRGAVPKLPRLPKPRPRDGRVFFIDVPGAAQSAVYLMHFGPQRKARDYFATSLASAVLGGGFASRVNMNLREDKGYSYGAGGGVRYTRDYGELVLRTSVRSNTTYQSVLEMYGELSDLAAGKRPPSADEMTREKNSAILGMPGRFATAREALGQYRTLVYHALPLNYYDTYVKKVEGVKDRKVAAAAKKHFKPGEALFLVVGDASAPVIRRDGDKDAPFEKDGKPMVLLDAMQELVASGAIGRGELIRLDADGNVVSGQ